MIPGLYYLDHI